MRRLWRWIVERWPLAWDNTLSVVRERLLAAHRELQTSNTLLKQQEEKWKTETETALRIQENFTALMAHQSPWKEFAAKAVRIINGRDVAEFRCFRSDAAVSMATDTYEIRRVPMTEVRCAIRASGLLQTAIPSRWPKKLPPTFAMPCYGNINPNPRCSSYSKEVNYARSIALRRRENHDRR